MAVAAATGREAVAQGRSASVMDEWCACSDADKTGHDEVTSRAYVGYEVVGKPGSRVAIVAADGRIGEQGFPAGDGASFANPRRWTFHRVDPSQKRVELRVVGSDRQAHATYHHLVHQHRE